MTRLAGQALLSPFTAPDSAAGTVLADGEPLDTAERALIDSAEVFLPLTRERGRIALTGDALRPDSIFREPALAARFIRARNEILPVREVLRVMPPPGFWPRPLNEIRYP